MSHHGRVSSPELERIISATLYHRHQATLELRDRVDKCLTEIEENAKRVFFSRKLLLLFFDHIVNPIPTAWRVEQFVEFLRLMGQDHQDAREPWLTVHTVLDLEAECGREAQDFLGEVSFRDELTRRTITRQQLVSDTPSWLKASMDEELWTKTVEEAYPEMEKGLRDKLVKEMLTNNMLFTAYILEIRKQWHQEIADRVYGPL